uniref:BTB domain-containing protein n=1 Tax=Panagrolaimus sp. JU765 TaxID=591449 RepID=A0AC34RP97_9BILA
MVLEIVQTSRFIVPESSIDEDKEFTSRRERTSVRGYSYRLYCEENEGNIGIYLYMDCKKPVTVSCTFTVNSIDAFNFDRTFEESGGFGTTVFGKKSKLFVDGFMIVDASLKIEFISEKEKVFDELPHSVALLNDEKFKDFTIRAENKEIKVHKNIIAIASPVFSAMFESHTKEFKKDRVIIEDFDFETVKAGVELMYTRKVDDTLSIKTSLNLYKFADKYDLLDTKKVLEELTEEICLETVLEISKFSLANCLDTLYDECVEYYAEDFDEISQKIDGFQQLDSQFVMDAVNKKYRLAKL